MTKSFKDNFDEIFNKTEEMLEDDEEQDCSWCGGCGEGMYDGASCRKCKGSGIEPIEMDDDV
jgi:DnaJ-class molecular chaperone